MKKEIVVINYGAGNLRSVLNALEYIGIHDYKIGTTPDDIKNADRIIMPGVGHFDSCILALKKNKIFEPLFNHISEQKPYLGICIGLHILCEKSEEAPNILGLNILNNINVEYLNSNLSIPHIGWNSLDIYNEKKELDLGHNISHLGRMYFAHSYCIDDKYTKSLINDGWTLLHTNYGNKKFISMIRRNNVIATQFHLEKSGKSGLQLLKWFINDELNDNINLKNNYNNYSTGIAKRIIACLDVRRNDFGKLVVTKGCQYNVRNNNGLIIDLGDPVFLAEKYYHEGADEIIFLSIKSFDNDVSEDYDLLDIISRTTKRVFIPICIGGGIRNSDQISGLKIAEAYFNAGADKMAITSDAVKSAEAWFTSNRKTFGTSCIEQIAARFGKQAVVLSIDAKCIIDSKMKRDYYATSKGGKIIHDIKVCDLIIACEALGAGEILINSIDNDGTNSGFNIDLIDSIKRFTRLPLIASSGAGTAEHFLEVFKKTNVEAALAAGIFHRKEVFIQV